MRKGLKLCKPTEHNMIFKMSIQILNVSKLFPSLRCQEHQNVLRAQSGICCPTTGDQKFSICKKEAGNAVYKIIHVIDVR